MIHAGKLNHGRARSNKFHSHLPVFGLISPRVGEEKQFDNRRKPIAHRYPLGREECRDEMAGRNVAAHLGAAVGGTSEMELVQCAALRGGLAGSNGGASFVLAGVENGKTYQPAW
jgi:hypothetical protein